MAATVATTTVVFPAVILGLSRSPQVHAYLRVVMEQVAGDLRGRTPVRTGAGRASITAAVVMDASGWVGLAGWDVPHYYLGILNSRSHFAEPAIQRVRFV